MGYDAPFAGLTVLDLSQGIAGPYCGMLLAQQGANVIKVEPVDGGDWARNLGISYEGQTAYSITGNIGKRSLALDLKIDDGIEILWRLAEQTDVFMEGYRPGVISRLGFGYDSLSQRNPGVVYLSVSGFGQTGPLAERPALDPALQALTGMMSSNKGPHRVMFIPVDMATGLYSFQALSSALYARRDEEKGCYIDNSLMRSGLALQSVRLIANTLESGEMTPGASPHGVFSTQDGWITLVVLRNSEFAPFCEAIARPEFADDEKFSNAVKRHQQAAILTPAINETMSAQPSAYWSGRLKDAGIVHEILNEYPEFLEHPQTKADNAVSWLNQPGLSGPAPIPNLAGIVPPMNESTRGTAPLLGQHSREILEELDFAAEHIESLAQDGVIAGPDLPTLNA